MKQRKPLWATFPYTILITLIYVTLGFCFNIWHPAWLLFLTVPIYNWVVEFLMSKRDQDD